MNAQTSLKTGSLPATDAMILDHADPLSTAMPQRALEAVLPVHAASQVEPDFAGRWRGGLLQQYESTIRCSWRHGGLND
jgi:hypothetical protein